MNRMSGRMLAAVLCVGAVGLVGGCKSSEKASDKASPSVMNSTCPFSGKPVAEGATASYGDKKVGFCCNGCASKFNGMSEAEKQAKIAGVK